MILENKLGIKNAAELARVEEKKSKVKTLELAGHSTNDMRIENRISCNLVLL